MDILVDELHDAVFQSASLIPSFFPLPQEHANDIRYKINTLSSQWFLSNQNPNNNTFSTANLNPSDERKNYPALAYIFNKIADIARPYSGFHSQLHFRCYDRPASDQADGKGPLKPDLIAISGTPTAQRYPWAQIQIAVEVKGTWELAFKQAATYGRSILEIAKRTFAIVIIYNNASKFLRFCFFTRVGLFTTNAMSLTTPAGFDSVATALIGIMVAPDEATGVDHHHLIHDTHSYIYLPLADRRLKGAWCRVTDLLCQRICIRGRGTHVYSVQHLNLPHTTHHLPHTAITVNSQRRGPVTRSATRALTGSQPIQNTQPLNLTNSTRDSTFESNLSASHPPMDFESTFISSAPHTLVIKESWPYEDRAALEPQMFRDIQGQHGAPDVAGAISYSSQLPFIELKDLCQCTDFPAVYSTPGACPKPESRILVRMVCATLGNSLMTIADQPGNLVKALIDGMIGLFIPLPSSIIIID
jgi:Fungal protein kinase